MKKLAPFASVALALALAGCGQKQPATDTADAPTVVEVTPVKSQLLATTLQLPAQLLPYESVDIYPKVAGYIDALPVDRGSRVHKGDLLVSLSAPEVTAQRGQAAASLRAVQAQMLSAKAKLAADEATYERLANAARTPGVVAENDVNIARETAAADRALMQSASETIAASNEALRSAGEMSAYLKIRAPFDGVITARNLHPGALVGPEPGASAQPILQLVRADHLRLTVAVPENSVEDAKPGTMIAFTAPPLPGRTFQAPVARIAQSIDARTRTMMVEADVPNPKGELAAGGFATVQWPIQRSYPTLRVPLTAIANDQERQFVIRVSGGVAHWVDVKTGMTADGSVEVFGALNPGDLVLKRGTDAIRDGQKVKVK